MQCNQ